METLNASVAKREFGELLLKVQSDPVGINKNVKSVAVVVSVCEYQPLKAIKEENLKQLLQVGLDDLQAGKVSNGKAIINRLHQRIIQIKN